MEWIYILLNALFVFLLGLFVKNYLPSYMDEKGKNLATKEDIQEITRKTEEVQQEFRENFELFSSDVQFKYDFYYKQYSELYCKLYAIIIQSEYVRHFIKKTDGKDISFDEAPFLEVTKTKTVTYSFEFKEGEPVKKNEKEEEIETPISQFNKKQMCDYIIDKGEFASQKLLKLAVSYRFAYNYYSGNPDANTTSCQEVADDEEIRLIKEMVCCIVSEYNNFRKELKMEYDEEELKTGIPQCELHPIC